MMFKMFKKMLAVFMVAMLIVPMLPISVFAEVPESGKDLSDLAAELQKVYPYIDADEKQHIRDARSSLINLSADNWDEVLQLLLTDGVIDRLGGNAQDTLKQAALDAASIYYTDDAVELEQRLTQFKDKHLSTFRALFDDEITMNDLAEFLIAARSKLKSEAFSKSDTILYGTNAELAEAMPEIVREAAQKAIAQPEFDKFRGKLTAIGWSAGLLVDQHQVLAGIVDQDHQAELALAKAWVRSEATVKKGDETLTPVGTLYKDTIKVGEEVAYTLSIIDKIATGLVNYKLVHGDAGDALEVNYKSGKMYVKGLLEGSGQLIFFRDGKGCNAENDWIAKVDITVTGVTLELDRYTACPGDSVTASGTADADTLISIKVVDSLGNIVFFDGVKSDSEGNYSLTFRVPYVAPGTLTIVAGYGTNVATKELTVTEKPVVVPVTGVSITEGDQALDIGSTVQLTAVVEPANATNKGVTWSSSDDAVATVDASGLVTAVSAGTATIIVTTVDGEFTASIEVTVKEPIVTKNIVSVKELADIEVAYGTAQENIGLPAQVEVTLNDDTTINVDITWECKDYDGEQSGDYTFTGTLINLPENVTNTQNLIATVNVIVAEKLVTDVTLELSTDTACPGDSITASGTADANNWVSIKVIDKAGSIVFFDAVKSDTEGNYNLTFRVPYVDPGTLTIVAGYGTNVDTKELTVTEPVVTKDIVSVADIADIEVAYGTAQENIGLPNQVSVTLNDDTTINVDVTWECDDYDSNQVGTYTFTGTLINLPDDVTNTQNLIATVNVIVAEKLVTDVTLELSTDSAYPGDSITASGEADANNWVSIKVIDKAGSIVFFDATKTDSNGNYSLTFKVPYVDSGTLTVVAGYGTNVATKELTVTEPVVTKDIVSVADIADIEVAYGTAQENIGLPNQVSVTLDDDTTINVDVTWECEDYDGEQSGDYTFTGTLVNLPANVTNTQNLTATVKVTVAKALTKVTLELDRYTACPGDSVIASGKADANNWVSIKVLDNAGQIVFFDATKSDVKGDYSLTFRVPYVVPGILTVVAGYGANVATKGLTVVTERIPVTGVSIVEGDQTLYAGGTFQLTAVVEPVNATNKDVTWSSSNDAVATVDASGLVTTVSAGTATITVTTADGEFTASIEMTVKEPIVTKNIVSVKELADIEVAYGTAQENIGLPNQVSVTLEDDTTINIDVTWECATYDVEKSGDYTFTGTLVNLPANVTNTQNLTATVKVTVAEKPIVTKDIVKVAEIADINVAYGTAQDKLDLPIQVEITLDDGSKVNVDVNWDNGTPAYDGNQAGTYIFTGTLVNLPEGVTNTEGLTATVNVIVAEKPLSNDASLVSITVEGPAGELTPLFNPDIKEYMVKYTDKPEKVPTVSAKANHKDATVQINQVSTFKDYATIVVTAPDGKTTRTYTVKFVVKITIDPDKEEDLVIEDIPLVIEVTPEVVEEDRQEATLPKITVTDGTVELQIPAATKVAGPGIDKWDGTIQLPTILDKPSVTIVGDIVVIEVGVGKDASDNDIVLEFDKAVRLIIPGQAGKTAAYIRNGKLFKITGSLSEDTQEAADSDIPEGEEAALDVDNDKVIWTKHFTEFLTYEEKDVKKVVDLGDINVAYGTAQENIGLLAQVEVTLNDDTTTNVDVTWECATYDGEKSGDYTFTGTLVNLPANVTNTQDLTATVKVIVAEKPIVTKDIVSVEELADINVAYGTAQENIDLLDQVEVTLDDNTTINVDVTWECEDYDGEQSGDYTFTGTLINLPENVTNTQNLTATVKVTVAEELVTDVILELSTDTACPGDSITASGTADANNWVSIKVIDKAGSIVFFDAVKSDTEGNYNLTFRVPYVDPGTLTVVAGYGTNVATKELTVTEPVVTKDIVSVADIADIEVAYGTAQENIGLPNQVSVTLNDDTTINVDVTWECDDYDSNQVGTYTFTGTLINLPDDVTNTQNLIATVNVIVAEKLVTDVTLELSTDSAYPGDSITASGTADANNWVSIKVIDKAGHIVFFDATKTNAEGNYSLTFRVPYVAPGTLTVVAGYGTNVATKELTVTEPVVTKDIVSVADIADINVAYGTAQENIDLPDQVSVTLDDDTTINVDVTWECKDYDGEQARGYTFTGTLVNLPANVTNTQNLTATVKVIVAEKLVTDVTLELSTDTACPGDSITASGTADANNWVSIKVIDKAGHIVFFDATKTNAEGNYSLTFRVPYVAPGTLTVVAGYGTNVATKELTVTEPVVTKDIVSVADIADINVAYGTAQENIDLPDQVEVTLDDNTTINVDVTWECKDYDGEQARGYTFTGTLVNLPANVTNTQNLTATVKVIVAEKLVTDVTLELSTDTACPGDSITASGTADANNWVSIKVIDKAGHIVFFDATKTNAEGNYSLTFRVPYVAPGTLTVVAGYGTNVATKELTVTEPVVTKDIVSVADIADIEVAYGTAQENLDLPDQISVTLDDDTTTNVDVTWECATYDGEKSGDYTFTGTLVNLPANVTNTQDLTATVKVIVAEKPIVTKDIVSVEELADINVAYGTAQENIDLLDQVEVTLDDNTTINVDVTWECEDYDGEQSGDYTFTGTLINLPENVTNTQNLTATVKVTVAEELVTDVILELSTDTACPGDSITASGTADANNWVSIKVIDKAGSIVFFDAVKSDTEGNYNLTFRVPYVDPGTLTVVAGYGTNVATKELTVTEPVVTKDIVSVADIADINVAYGTAQENIDLPDQVSVTLDDDTTINVDVTWECKDYDGEQARGYTFTGTLVNLPANVTNTQNLTATVKVIVAEKLVTDVTLELSTDTACPGDSITASGTADANNWVSIKVIDKAGHIVFFDATKTNAEGNYSLTFRVPYVAPGTLTVVAGYGTNVATKELTVTEPVVTKDIVSVADIADINVAYGTAQENIDLPDQVEVTLDDNTTINVDVTWECKDYDGEQARGYTFTGTLVNLPANVTNTQNLTATVKVIVAEKLVTDVTLELSTDTACPGDSITASGTADANNWVSIKVIDKAGHIVFFDATKTNAEGNYSLTFRVPYVAPGTLTVVAGYGTNVATKELTVTEPVVTKDIVSVADIADINVAYGTAQENIGLLAQVEVTLNDDTTTNVDVTWECATYDGEKSGDYTFTGTLVNLPANVTNTQDLTATVKVIVAEKPIVTKDIVSVEELADINVAYGTAQENIGLPSQVEVTLDDDTTINVDVTWECATYDGNQAGTYTFTGTLINLPDDVTNTQNLTAAVKVIVKPKKTPPVGGGGPSGPPPFGGTEIKIDKGGKVSEHGATLEIPANAFAKDLRVKIAKVTDISGLPLPEGGQLASEVLEITKDEKGDFTKPVTITMTFDKSKVDSKAEIAIYYYNPSGKTWIMLDNIKVDWEKGTVSGEIDHFTKFAVIAVTPEEELPVPVILTDIAGHWAEANIMALVEKGAIAGYPDQTFRPNSNITRAEFATVLVKAFQLEAKEGRVFADTATHWAKDAIATAGAYGIIKGYSDDKFGPNDNITREQMAVMIAKAVNLTIGEQAPVFSDSAKISDWAKDAVAAAAEAEIIKGYPDGSFRPQGPATRAEAVTVIVKALEIN